MNMFKFVLCSKNEVQVQSTFNEIVYDPPITSKFTISKFTDLSAHSVLVVQFITYYGPPKIVYRN